MLERCYNNDYEEIQLGIDESGRGCLAGPVFVGAVIWNPYREDEVMKEIKDSKKLNKQKRSELRDYIEENALYYCVKSIDEKEIDSMNILNATYKAMHMCIDEVAKHIPIDRLLIDGNSFKKYDKIKHNCIIGGDNKYISIAAASILAKTYHDEYIETLSEEDDYKKYNWNKNMCYGTKQHILSIKNHGISSVHRKSFCKNLT
jgi:ribonuclease HII